MIFTPSKYQAAIYDFMETGTGNAVIGAVAGSGKSTTLINAIDFIPPHESVLMLAFNADIVEELKLKVTAPNVDVKTLHSLGLSMITSNGPRPRVEPGKYRSFVRRAIKSGSYLPAGDLTPIEFTNWKSNILALIGLIRVNLVRSWDEANALALRHGIHLLDNELEVVNSAIKYGRNNRDEIDYIDMVYFPNIFDMRAPLYDWVFIDECQDLNAVQRNLFLKCVKPGTGRFIAVGDPRQAIYGFAGADADSYQQLTKIPNTVKLPLSQCFRCAKSIVAQAKRLVPQIEAFAGSPEGEVDYQASTENVKDGDMIVCRLTSPLVSQCMAYISSGVKAYVKGRNIGKSLISLLEDTRKSNLLDAIKALNKELAKIAVLEADRLDMSVEEAKSEMRYTKLEDQIAALLAIGHGLTQTRQATKRIKAIFSDGEKSGICLSTIHKSKGLEADRVFILHPEKLYNKRSMGKPWMAQQEENLEYVAITRAKKYLGFIPEPKKF